MPTYQKENLKGKLCRMNCTRSMTQCMSLHVSDQGFPNRGGRNPPRWRGWEFCLEDLIYMMVETWEVILTIRTFSRPKTTFCKYWTFIKIKIGLTCVYNEYEVKIKKVKVQWLQPKIKFLVCYNINFWLVGGDSSHPTSRESLTNMFEV